MHGEADKRVPAEVSKRLYDALRARGVKARIILIPGADHEWGGADKTTIDRIYADVQEFLDQTFGLAKPAASRANGA
jgi:dipeptidyl aminopeptidase/acylaminoacyl peptidase